MKAVILAAGLGSRINSITKNIPKSMIKINGKFIFRIVLEGLANSGIKEIIFVIGYKHKLLKDEILKECKDLDYKIKFVLNNDFANTNTMYSLWLAKNHLDCSFVSLHGDLIYNNKMFLDFIKNGKNNSILVDQNFPSDWDDAMKIIEHKKELKYMSKQITYNEMDGIAIGIYKFDKIGGSKLFKIITKLIKKGVVSSWVSEAINILAKEIPVNVSFIDKNHQWTDVDNLTDLESGIRISKKIFEE